MPGVRRTVPGTQNLVTSGGGSLVGGVLGAGKSVLSTALAEAAGHPPAPGPPFKFLRPGTGSTSNDRRI
jgi:hypothetical protein